MTLQHIYNLEGCTTEFKCSGTLNLGRRIRVFVNATGRVILPKLMNVEVTV